MAEYLRAMSVTVEIDTNKRTVHETFHLDDHTDPVAAAGRWVDDVLDRAPFDPPKRLLADLFGDVWCQTCEHTHIPGIPAVTFQCAGGAEHGCGFGQWSPDMAEEHATDWPDHVVHAVLHRVVPIEERPEVGPEPGTLAYAQRVAETRGDLDDAATEDGMP